MALISRVYKSTIGLPKPPKATAKARAKKEKKKKTLNALKRALRGSNEPSIELEAYLTWKQRNRLAQILDPFARLEARKRMLQAKANPKRTKRKPGTTVSVISIGRFKY